MWYKQAQLQDNKIMYIMRSLPAAGKSTLAKKLAGENGVIFSTDEFFYDEKGTYNFDVNKLHRHHEANLKRAKEAVDNGVSPIVIDNTNISIRDFYKYAQYAHQHGYNVEYATPDTPWAWDIDAIMTKQEETRTPDRIVPRETIERMQKRFQTITDPDEVLKYREQNNIV